MSQGQRSAGEEPAIAGVGPRRRVTVASLSRRTVAAPGSEYCHVAGKTDLAEFDSIFNKNQL